MSTRQLGPRLESHQPQHRDQRMAIRRLRVALHALIAFPGGQNTPRPESPWHDLTRNDPRAVHPCEKERAMIASAIRQDCTTPDQVLSYFLARLEDAMAEFPNDITVSTVCYVRLMAEAAEMVEAQTLARGLGTDEAYTAAERETADIIPLAQLCVAGAFRRPMGVPR